VIKALQFLLLGSTSVLEGPQATVLTVITLENVIYDYPVEGEMPP
jgi:hypothetical protein